MCWQAHVGACRGSLPSFFNAFELNMLSISFSGLAAGNTTNQRGTYLPDFAEYRQGPNLLQAIFVSAYICQLPVLLTILCGTSCLLWHSLDIACYLLVKGHHSLTSRLCVFVKRTQQNKKCMHVTLHLLLTWAGFAWDLQDVACQ